MSDKKTCQICGKEHKTPNGRIANHGYSIMGYHSGTCLGSRMLPYEESCDGIQSVIDQIRIGITKIEKNIDNIASEPLNKSWMAGGKRVTKLVELTDTNIVFKDKGSTINFLTCGYKDKADAEDKLRKDMLQRYRSQISFMCDEIQYLKRRIDNWKKVD